MSEPRDEAAGGCPALIVAHADPAYAEAAALAFRQRGWDVYLVGGPEVRRLARDLPSATVVLDAELPGESGWLTCDKLVRDVPGLRVILVASAPASEDARMAEFVGAAALVSRRAGPPALLQEAGLTPLHAAG
jgi:DNA-binding response OmpR family regulator